MADGMVEKGINAAPPTRKNGLRDGNAFLEKGNLMALNFFKRLAPQMKQRRVKIKLTPEGRATVLEKLRAAAGYEVTEKELDKLLTNFAQTLTDVENRAIDKTLKRGEAEQTRRMDKLRRKPNDQNAQ